MRRRFCYSQPASDRASQLANNIQPAVGYECVCVMQTLRVRRVPEGQNTRRDNTKRAHLRLWKLKTDAAVAQNISILNGFAYARRDFAPARRCEKSCECCSQNQSCAAVGVVFFKCLRDLSVGVMDNDLRPAQKTQFFISDSHQ